MKPSAVLNSIDIAREDQNFPALVALLSTATDGSQAEAICRAIEDLASLPEQLELQGRAGILFTNSIFGVFSDNIANTEQVRRKPW
jgi:hypothetical protein